MTTRRYRGRTRGRARGRTRGRTRGRARDRSKDQSKDQSLDKPNARPTGRRGRRVRIHPDFAPKDSLVFESESRTEFNTDHLFEPRSGAAAPATLNVFESEGESNNLSDSPLNTSSSNPLNISSNSPSDELNEVNAQLIETKESVDLLTVKMDQFIKEAYYSRMISIIGTVIVILCGIAIFLINRFIICPDSS
jgi:hypothetical protein